MHAACPQLNYVILLACGANRRLIAVAALRLLY